MRAFHSVTLARQFKPLRDFFCVAASACLMATASWAQTDIPTLRITTGGTGGVYFKLANEIAQILPDDVPLEVVVSDGSVHNLRRLLAFEGSDQDEYFQLAIVQADVLAQLRERARGNGVLEPIVERIKVVMPLHIEEIHAYALENEDVRSLEEILDRGLRINARKEKSGTNLTTRWIFEQLGARADLVDIVNVVPSDTLENIGLTYGVLFDVAGAPNDRGRRIEPDQGVTLVPIDIPSFYEEKDSPYVRSEITREHYTWLTRDIQTMGVQALLVAFDYDERNPFCRQIERMTRAIKQNIDLLKDPATGTDRAWREVDLIKGSQRDDLYACSASVIQGN